MIDIQILKHRRAQKAIAMQQTGAHHRPLPVRRQVGKQRRYPKAGSPKQAHPADLLTRAKKLLRLDHRTHHAHRTPVLQMLRLAGKQPFDLSANGVLSIGSAEDAERPMCENPIALAIVNHAQLGVVVLLLKVVKRCAHRMFFTLQPLQKIPAPTNQQPRHASREVLLGCASLQLNKLLLKHAGRQRSPSVCHSAHTDDRMQRVVHKAWNAKKTEEATKSTQTQSRVGETTPAAKERRVEFHAGCLKKEARVFKTDAP